MTFAGALLPWFVFKKLIRQIAASRSFTIGGEYLGGIRVDDTFYLIDLPTRSRGLTRLLQLLSYLLPAGLVVRHSSCTDLLIEDERDGGPRFLPARQIDPDSILLEFFTPTEAAVRKSEASARRTIYKAGAAIRRSLEADERALYEADERERAKVRQATANRAAANLKQ